VGNVGRLTDVGYSLIQERKKQCWRPTAIKRSKQRAAERACRASAPRLQEKIKEPKILQRDRDHRKPIRCLVYLSGYSLILWRATLEEVKTPTGRIRRASRAWRFLAHTFSTARVATCNPHENWVVSLATELRRRGFVTPAVASGCSGGEPSSGGLKCSTNSIGSAPKSRVGDCRSYWSRSNIEHYCMVRVYCRHVAYMLLICNSPEGV